MYPNFVSHIHKYIDLDDNSVALLLKYITPLKLKRKEFLLKEGYTVTDYGTYSDESTDYPEYGHKVAEAVENGKERFGITFCGSGNGINMTVNKHAGIRSALCWKKEIAALARQHNDANICALPARFISNEEAFAIVQAFLAGTFEGGRHERRIKKIPIS